MEVPAKLIGKEMKASRYVAFRSGRGALRWKKILLALYGGNFWHGNDRIPKRYTREIRTDAQYVERDKCKIQSCLTLSKQFVMYCMSLLFVTLGQVPWHAI